jgi:hypothetical protein
MTASDAPQMPSQGPITMQVRMEDPADVDMKEGFESHDCCEGLMREFLKACGFSYKTPFTCGAIVIEKPRRGPLARRPGVRNTKVEDGYGGSVFILNDDAVSKVRIVCAGDFQNVVCAAVTQVVAGEKTLEEATKETRQLFQLIPEGSSRAEIEAALRWAVDHKGSWPYAEARLYQPVRARDGRFARHR